MVIFGFRVLGLGFRGLGFRVEALPRDLVQKGLGFLGYGNSKEP